MLASPEGRLGLVASSSEAMRLLELFELQAEEGPCLDAFPHRGARRAAGPGGRVRPLAVVLRRRPREGFQSVSALPLRFRDVTLGALNLFGVTQVPMSEADVTVARAFTGLATLSIVQRRATVEAQRVNEQLSATLASRVVIEQATGLLAGRRRRRPGRGLLPAAGLRPRQQTTTHRCRPGDHRRHPRSHGVSRLPRRKRLGRLIAVSPAARAADKYSHGARRF